jgi:hypothetical protein
VKATEVILNIEEIGLKGNGYSQKGRLEASLYSNGRNTACNWTQ